MSIVIKEVKTKKDIKQFVNFQFELYKDDKFFVPPIKRGAEKVLQADKNPSFDFCEAKFFLAFKNNKCVGRITGILNHKYIKKTDEKLMRFSQPEFIDDTEVSTKLFEAVEDWAKENGAIGIHGPLGFTNLDTQGLLIEGFDYLPSIASVYNKKYYQNHIEKLNYEKEIDWIEFRLKIEKTIPAKAVKLNTLLKNRYELEVIRFSSNKELVK
ncbi:MAG: hypothetical protein U9R42_12475 [Bacteroidota bacterium]|nr:hypothetical protein [Bacteroidota bacterium]